MSMVRALIVDLLQATGMSRLDARAALADTWGRPFADDHNPTVTEDDASTLGLAVLPTEVGYAVGG